ncbi:MAG: acetyl-CoA acetyltransferase [Ferrovum sp. 37-45-19]|uniref:acetyl-CoA C-acyltransferase n=1 Tax=Ferrovum sp. JA12 TaxID=1356299 RepID=UPI0007033D61|nr:acetyl-CoA C-acyltransferase [Ferrovum sp. JA12]OYV80359.1 MAG: acetyl-CoA acetyltransferase [Ferrovum sp. 21-44-67]OYV95103.1 MAG: acetyl-CoA acetyltransferase [Ferrovum sp. 37-45-19]OZB31827.1 MAG: acetyl-CoA acetyltransferase [Ferrovum sp. 34-44-207]HQT80831.1 acetyl-CoA C-acyltransferase [Ferrovaceae bacterium]KRH78673.1 3-ketoacyl-CoA thiolase [Ferrovum sp. JA12]
MKNDVFIVAAKRSPVGRAPTGQLSHVRADELVSQVTKGLLQSIKPMDYSAINDFILGCAMPEGEQGLNLARVVALMSGLPTTVAGMTVNRFCASGLSAIEFAYQRIALGEADLMLAGGVESMSRIPMGGFRSTLNASFLLDSVGQSLALGMGQTAENLAQQWHISREEQDAYALLSHQRALAAQRANYFTEETIPISVHYGEADLLHLVHKSRESVMMQDECPRPETSQASLSKLKPVFSVKGSVTAGNSSPLSDGAAMLLLASEKAIKEQQLTPMARVVGFHTTGVPPHIMGIGPVEAVPPLLRRHGINSQELDWIELNEAFAAQVLAVQKTCAFNPDRLNPLGSAIALGHPLGATGAIRTTTLVHGLQRTGGRYGMVTLCVGMGQGIAAVFEKV